MPLAEWKESPEEVMDSGGEYSSIESVVSNPVKVSGMLNVTFPNLRLGLADDVIEEDRGGVFLLPV